MLRAEVLHLAVTAELLTFHLELRLAQTTGHTLTLEGEVVALRTHWSLTGRTAIVAWELGPVTLRTETGALPLALPRELARLRAELLLTLGGEALSHHWLTLRSDHLSALGGELGLTLRAAEHSALRGEALHAWVEGTSLWSHRWALWAEAL